MDNLIELATFKDENYGLVVQFLDSQDNCLFYILEEINGEKKYTRVDDTTNRILEEKYFSIESEINE